MKNEDIKRSLDSILHRVQKPARYTGGEYNSIVKKDVQVRAAISYPDLYEIGMANNGIRILYEYGNRLEGIACERVFAVEADFERELRMNNVPLFTLETFTPLCHLDLLGFNLSHELLYTNMLHILDLGNIPLLRADRVETDPVIIAGGECVSNPFPAADFVDLFFIGEGEHGFTEILSGLAACRRSGLSRNETIARLGEIGGVLVSADYSFSYDGINVSTEGMKRVMKRVVREGAEWQASKPPVPNIRISQERAVVEIARGCHNLCKFCHAGYYNMPYRTCACGDVESEIFRQLNSTGYSEVTLNSLSSGDYRDIVRLLNSVMPRLTEEGISLALPSLKVDKNTLPVIELVSNLRKTSLTFAVESASPEIRSSAYKKVKEDDLLDIVTFAFTHGWRVIKLYFMIGLPGCEEVDEAAEISRLLGVIARAPGKGKREINVTISPFVPKPHTPFQYHKQMDMEYFDSVIRTVRRSAPRSVTIKNHDIRSSFIEGLMARADTRMGAVILAAYRNSAKFDSWHEHFRFDAWMDAINEHLPHWREYLAPRTPGTNFPWQVIETGSERAVEAMRGRCLDLENYHQPEKRYRDELDTSWYKDSMKRFEEKYNAVQKIRLRVSKTGYGMFVPHIDFMEIMKRAFRMAGLPVAFSQGFNKRERISAGFPSPVGVESMAELLDVELYREIQDPQINEWISIINTKLPEFLKVESAGRVDAKAAIMALTAAVRYSAVFEHGAIPHSVGEILSADGSITKRGKNGEKEFPLREVLHSYEIDGNRLDFILYTGNESSIRADEFLRTVTGAEHVLSTGVSVTKMCQYVKTESGMEVLE
ncbi:MAG TPA: TIGR03960 family B12-binding radical SAM protein [Spirochaetota bacterium]|nr:TIGR03960 family B12-binding radical SAM protein [Spirochaetota bacterium]